MRSSAPKKELALEIFGRLAPRYDAVLEYATLFQDRCWKKKLLASAPISRDSSVLDLGSGTGVLEESLLPYPCSVVGVDLTEQMVRLAARKGLPRSQEFITGDAECIPFKDGSFDVVLSCYLVKYSDPLLLLSEVARVLRPGGKLALYDFSRPSGPFMLFHAFYLYGVLSLAGRLLKRLEPGISYTYMALPSIIRSSLWVKQLALGLRGDGFEDAEMKRLTGGVVTLFLATRR